MSRATRWIVLGAITVVVSAHIGSPDTYYEGAAGPYPIRVIVRSPGVVPGQAEIIVRLLAPRDVRRVLALPVFWDPRTAAPPPPDIARPVPGDPTLYRAALWLMRGGAYGVQVSIEGAQGTGVALVPVQAVATRRLGVSRPLAAVLTGLATLLLAGAITIVGAAAREAMLPPGQAPDQRQLRRARVAMAMSTAVFAVLLAGGRTWWRAVDAAYQRELYRPRALRAEVLRAPGPLILRVAWADSATADRSWTPLIPDHGHLLHLFLVRDSGLAAFAHLHPALGDPLTFAARLPPLPAGRYRLYGDVVHESGFAETLTGAVDIPEARGPWQPSDPDDAWVAGAAAGEIGEHARPAPLGDGAVLYWEGHGSVRAGEDALLRFAVRGPDQRPTTLTPYMGMAAHLVLTRDDGAVFVHLHPAGTISLAAQQAFLLREAGDTAVGTLARRFDAMQGSMHHADRDTLGSDLAFPYAFPEPGRYRLWIQVRRRTRILTGVVDVSVLPARLAPG